MPESRTTVANLFKRFRHRFIYPLVRRFLPYREVSYGAIAVRYKKHLDGGGTWFGQDLIAMLQARGMPRQPRVFEWCAGPGFIGFSLLAHGLCETLCLADINPAAVAACRATISRNGLGDRVSVYLSDNLKSIPDSEHWDLVVANPPHFVDAFIGELRSHDPGWSIHRGFLATVGRFLKPGGVIVLQENNAGSTVDTFRGMIEQSGFAIVFVQDAAPERTHEHRYYYIAIMRAGDTPPAWAKPR